MKSYLLVSMVEDDIAQPVCYSTRAEALKAMQDEYAKVVSEHENIVYSRFEIDPTLKFAVAEVKIGYPSVLYKWRVYPNLDEEMTEPKRTFYFILLSQNQIPTIAFSKYETYAEALDGLKTTYALLARDAEEKEFRVQENIEYGSCRIRRGNDEYYYTIVKIEI